MTGSEGHDVTRILEAIGDGDEHAAEELFEVVYQELRGLARSFMAAERADHTLQPTAVVHEAYLRLLGGRAPRWENRHHFFAAAAEAMRRILVDHARHKLRLKRGGDRQRVELGDLSGPELRLEELVALDQALDRLAERDPEMAEVVVLRYFAGFTVDETADAMGASPRSVNRRWTAARSWLRRELGRSTPEPG